MLITSVKLIKLNNTTYCNPLAIQSFTINADHATIVLGDGPSLTLSYYDVGIDSSLDPASLADAVVAYLTGRR